MFPEGTTPASLNELCKGCLVSHIGIEFTEVGKNYLVARMPVNKQTRQPFGLLHGGASVVLAETLGSVAANLLVGPKGQQAVGLEINANHLRGKKEGFVYGKTIPVHIGKSTQLWEIRITDENHQLICVSKLTVAILDKK